MMNSMGGLLGGAAQSGMGSLLGGLLGGGMLSGLMGGGNSGGGGLFGNNLPQQGSHVGSGGLGSMMSMLGGLGGQPGTQPRSAGGSGLGGLLGGGMGSLLGGLVRPLIQNYGFARIFRITRILKTILCIRFSTLPHWKGHPAGWPFLCITSFSVDFTAVPFTKSALIRSSAQLIRSSDLGSYGARVVAKAAALPLRHFHDAVVDVLLYVQVLIVAAGFDEVLHRYFLAGGREGVEFQLHFLRHQGVRLNGAMAS
jgi:hypothetical protein